jgi:menaquinone-dependent protoporphyrinogen oxidase
MNRTLLVVYASRYGQTEKIARRIADVAQREGIAAGVVAVGDVAETELAESSDVIVAGSVYFGRHARPLSRFVRRNLAMLAKRHTAFVSVCGAAEEPGADLALARSYVGNFLRRTGWTPDTSATFGGAIPYSRYGWLLRRIMVRIATARGLGVDTSRDFDYTDWAAVDAFARTFIAAAQTCVA